MIKAIETKYAGCHFRSRTEARWAVFFDALGLEWEFEKEGFELPSGRYLPDFWLPEYAAWIEIKGDIPTLRERQLADELEAGGGHLVTVFAKPPGELFPLVLGRLDYDVCHPDRRGALTAASEAAQSARFEFGAGKDRALPVAPRLHHSHRCSFYPVEAGNGWALGYSEPSLDAAGLIATDLSEQGARHFALRAAIFVDANLLDGGTNHQQGRAG